MCLGVPMLVQSCEGNVAVCRTDNQYETVDLSLLGPQEQGTWVLVFLGTAREVLTEQRAEQVRQALLAVKAVMNGESENIDHLFIDLIEQEPQLPAHLQIKN